MVTGVITRDSIRNALMKGITAEQVKKQKKMASIKILGLDYLLFTIARPSTNEKRGKET